MLSRNFGSLPSYPQRCAVQGHRQSIIASGHQDNDENVYQKYNLVALGTDTRSEEKKFPTTSKSPSAAANTGTPVVRLASCLAQSEKSFPELECRSSIDKADKVLIAQLSSTSYLALGQIVRACCDAAGKSSVAESDPPCSTLPLLCRLGDNADVIWRTAACGRTVVVDNGGRGITCDLVSICGCMEHSDTYCRGDHGTCMLLSRHSSLIPQPQVQRRLAVGAGREPLPQATGGVSLSST